MADPRVSFPTLENGTQEGQVLRAMQEGDAPTSKNGSLAFAFKDSTGNVVLPQLDAEGKLPVTMDSAGEIKRARGTVADQNSSLADVTGASIILTADKTYINFGMVVSCRRAAYFELVQVDDLATTVLHSVILDAGQYSMVVALPVDQIVAGSSGTQTLKVRSKTFEKAADVYASLSCKEVS